MDLSIPGSDFQSPSITSFTPVFGDNVQDLLNVGTLHVSASSIITVNSIVDVVDDNDCITTLREAINFANADELEDLIVFERSLFDNEQTVELSLGQLDITHSLSIIAPRDEFTGANLLTVSGNNASRVFEIGTEATVTLTGLTVANGSVRNDVGGGIKNSGTLILDNSIVRNNTVTIDLRQSNIVYGGGGIYNSGTLTVNNSTLSSNISNTVNPGFYSEGGGIFNDIGGTATVNNSTLSDNLARVGGGIHNRGTLTVSNSTLSGNSVSFKGGGIDNLGTVTVINSTLSGNSANVGGGISNIRTRIPINSTMAVNSDSIMTVSNSTIIGNSASSGGGIYSAGILTLEFSTLTLNQARSGGGLYTFISELPGPNNINAANVRNTIIALNFLSGTNSSDPDVFGLLPFTSLGYNLIGNATATSSRGFGVTGDIVGTTNNPIDPRLASLDFNGGSTQTIALLPDSPAIDAGDPTVLDTDPTTDQRGFPRVTNGRADIGAFEFSESVF